MSEMFFNMTSAGFEFAKLGADFYIMCQSGGNFAREAYFFAMDIFLRKIGLYLQ